MTIPDRLVALATALEAECRAGDAQATGVPLEAVRAACRVVDQTRTAYADQGPAAAHRVLAPLARQVGVSWSYTSAVGAEVLACAGALDRT